MGGVLSAAIPVSIDRVRLVDIPDVPVIETDDGEKAQLEKLGSPVQVKAIGPVNPLAGVTLYCTVIGDAVKRLTESDVVAGDSVKDGGFAGWTTLKLAVADVEKS